MLKLKVDKVDNSPVNIKKPEKVLFCHKKFSA